MDPRERYESLNDTLQVVLRGWQADLQTSMPGIIQTFDPVKMTCTVQPAIMAVVTSPVDNKPVNTKLPILLDCPVYFPSGGGVTLTYPISPGDECLVVFANRCIDAWWQSGGVQPQAMYRMHDLSDGFVFVGIRSQPRKFTVSQAFAQLRTDDGAAVIEVNPTNHAVNITTSGVITQTAPSIVLNGAVTVNGTISSTGAMTGQGTDVHTHIHSGVQTGGGNTGGPV